jgi:hypothetical protein
MIEATVETDLVTINGLKIREAVMPDDLYSVLDKPSRIVGPEAPAPSGHRNNQVHVYDDLGIYFHEHHFTYQATSMTFLFRPEEERYRFTPRLAFTGRVRIGEYALPAQPAERDLAGCPVPLRCQLGSWTGRFGTIWIEFRVLGPRLRSGRRSRAKRVINLSVGWPHDPWAGGKPPSRGNAT